MRHPHFSTLGYQEIVSIHAPRAGCDDAVSTIDDGEACFNSRTPCGVRLLSSFCIFGLYSFQFTHPVRGATLMTMQDQNTPTFQFTHPVRGATAGAEQQDAIFRVSIHAPRAGCDSARSIGSPKTSTFQFTHPVRGATLISPLLVNCSMFQFTHPVRGATVIKRYVRIGIRFQFTHPVRGATRCNQRVLSLRSVSIHAPRAGCDRMHLEVYEPFQCFNSRTPCGVRHDALVSLEIIFLFQFTHPVRGATGWVSVCPSPLSVSIHAPRAGCDSRTKSAELVRFLFQFTHPVRGATSGISPSSS